MLAKLLAGSFLLISLSTAISAQDLDEDCNPIPVPVECVQVAETIRGIQNNITRLQERLRSASPTAKSTLLSSIERLNTQLTAAKAELRGCKVKYGAALREVAPEVLNATIRGEATLRTTDSEARGPFKTDFTAGLRFSVNRCSVLVASFPTIRLKTDDIPGIGRVDVTVTRVGGGVGRFHPVSGKLTIPIRLHFHYDTIFVGDDEAFFNLTTDTVPTDTGEASGTPLDADGNITLVGTATFRGGYLDGKLGGLLIKATISPRP